MKKKQKAQSGYVMPPDWYQQYTQTYGGIFPNQNGYINNQMQPINGTFPEVQVTAQGNPNQRYYGIQQPQPIPINYQRPKAQQENIRPLQLSQQQNEGISQQKAMGISNGISSVATGVGDVLDFFGDLKRSVLLGGASILNSLIPDQFNKRPEVPVIAYNPDQYGNQQYNNIYANGGTINIPKENRGLFTRKANTHDMGIQEYANYVLSHKDDFPLRTERQAQFAKNFNGKAQNGTVMSYFDQPIPSLATTYGANKPQTKRNTSLKNATSSVKDFYNDYLNSPNYEQRLIGQGYSNTDQVIQDRLNNINNIRTRNSNEGSSYSPKYNIVDIDKNDLQRDNIDMSTLLSHEFSHGVGSVTNSRNPNLNLNINDQNALNSRNNLFSKRSEFNIGSDQYHDSWPEEFKADLDALRYNLKKDNIYDTGKQEFNQQFLNKAKNKYKNNGEIQRLFRNVKNDNDLIWLMNNIAQNDLLPKNIQYALNGSQLSANKAKEILRDGTANGKKLTQKQKRYMGWIAGGKAENGIDLPINDTGYLQGYVTNKNPVNIIPSNSITTYGMNQPIYANGIPLYPNTGNYQFPTNQVIETPMYEVGQELNLTKAQRKALENQGYEFE